MHQPENEPEGFGVVGRAFQGDKGDVEFAVGTPSFQFPLFAKGQLPPIVKLVRPKNLTLIESSSAGMPDRITLYMASALYAFK